VHLVVVGGGGAMGRVTVRTLAEDERVAQVTVVDQSAATPERALAWLERGREKVQAATCDVRDEPALAALLEGADVVLNAADYRFNLHVMRAALAAHVSYADLGGLFHVTQRQYELDGAFRDAGLTAVLGLGSTPGITNLLARIAVDQLDAVERLDVRTGSWEHRSPDVPWTPPYSIRTIFDEFTLPPMVYQEGTWQAVPPLSGEEPLSLPDPIGRQTAIYTLHSEVALFPVSFADRGLRHVSFKIGFPPEFFSDVRLLVDLGLAGTDPVEVSAPEPDAKVRVAPRELLVALLANRTPPIDAPADPDDFEVLRVVARGMRDGAPVALTEDVAVRPYAPWHLAAASLDVGVPLAIGGILMASGVQRPGAHGAELVFEPRSFLRELARFGMRATEIETRDIQ
jgi:lysine 6-dehydrogenase